MGKYTVYEHPSGRACVGDVIAAFVPVAKGREVRQASVVRINRSSIRARYWDKFWYEVILKNHQWCFIKEKNEVIVDRDDFEKAVEDQKFLEALLAAGVDNWDGYDDAVAGE